MQNTYPHSSENKKLPTSLTNFHFVSTIVQQSNDAVIFLRYFARCTPVVRDVQMFLRIGVYLVKFERYYHTLREAQTSIDVTASSCKVPSVQRVCCIVTLTGILCLVKTRSFQSLRKSIYSLYRVMQKTVKGMGAGPAGRGCKGVHIPDIWK